MFRTAFFLTTALCAFPAFADDFRVNAPVTAVTVYPQGATLTRAFNVDVPAGQHRILVAMPEGMPFSASPRIGGLGGLSVGALEYLPDFVTDPETVYNADQTAALTALRAVEKQVQRDEDLVRRASVAEQAAAARIAFYRSVSAGSVDALDVGALRDVGIMVGQELGQALDEQQTASEAARGAQEGLAKTRRNLVQAQQDLKRLTPPSGPVNMLAITVDAAQPVSADLTLKHLVNDAYWSATYELDLDVDAGRIEMERKVIVVQNTFELWDDVALTLSTADPFAAVNPREVYPQQARVIDLSKKRVTSSLGDVSGSTLRGVAQPVMEVHEIVEAGVKIDGLSITYDYPQPVSISADSGALVLALGGFEFDADVFNQAAPRYDKTAFLMARFTNNQPEPILPGDIQLYRDGDFVGGSALGLLPAGEEATVSFGALEGLRLDYRVLNNDTGDRGILSTSNTRRQRLEFTVKNLTAEAETVETLFALPFTEQEDLSLKVAAKPAPDETDFDKRRGVGKWMLDLKAGESRTVTMSVDLSWPEGQELRWNP